MQTFNTLTLVSFAGLALACQFQKDSVDPGYYGTMQAGASSIASRTTGGASGTSATNSMTSGVATSGTGSTPMNGPMVGMAGMPASSGMMTAGAPSQSGSSGMAGAPTGPTQGASGAPGAAGGPTTQPTGGDCDMSGRWLSTSHLVADALGEPQYTHYYNYFEIEQQGTAFTIKKGLLCDADSVGVGDFAATSKFVGARESVAKHVNYAGQQGTSAMAAGGCKVDFDKWYTVRGATVPHYLDPTVPLPTVEQQASGSTPGWEDWDGDGNPGITGIVSGIVSGKIFAAPRLWTQSTGTVSDTKSLIKLSTQWNTEQNMLSYDGTPLLGSEAVRAADATLHFTQMARLAANQATGDDLAICKSILELAPSLTPAAAGN
jgi:hypothetical protein